ncbi:MAG TPA: HEAT repeat domain-containing protein [Gemmataceae bacterium]|nr:HEAT repeat domain-containing protein [Gemmataceae bacterium]
MGKARSLEAKLARLRSLRGEPPSPPRLGELRTALRDSSNLVVAEAAEIAGKGQLGELAPDLVAAFDRFLESPAKTDKQCRAKTAVVEALNGLEFPEEDVFLRGARYVQLEGVWGGSQDTAAPVRVACAFALVRLRSREAPVLLVDLLSDPEKAARAGAAQALAWWGTEAAGLLLRLKARVGDGEPEVLSECFNGLLKLRPDDGVAFVAEFFGLADQAVQEVAVLALGESRRPAAFEILKAFWERQPDATLRETALMALALLRLQAATDFLLSLAATGPAGVAESAVKALAIHRYDPRLVERTAAAVAQNGRAALRAHFEKRFHVKEEKG